MTELTTEERREFFRLARQMLKNGQEVSGACCLKDEDSIFVPDSIRNKEVWHK